MSASLRFLGWHIEPADGDGYNLYRSGRYEGWTAGDASDAWETARQWQKGYEANRDLMQHEVDAKLAALRGTTAADAFRGIAVQAGRQP